MIIFIDGHVKICGWDILALSGDGLAAFAEANLLERRELDRGRFYDSVETMAESVNLVFSSTSAREKLYSYTCNG